MTGPFNAAAHAFLIANGFEYKRMPADYDDGTPESGPGYGGHPEYDIYTDGIEDVYVSANGETGMSFVDQELLKWLDGHGDEAEVNALR